MNNEHHIVRRDRINANDFDCFYFCSHFYEAFKKTYSTTDEVVIESYELREALAYCKSYQKTYIRHFTQLNELSDAYFLEVRKFFIQYYPSLAADNYFVIVNIHNDD